MKPSLPIENPIFLHRKVAINFHGIRRTYCRRGSVPKRKWELVFVRSIVQISGYEERWRCKNIIDIRRYTIVSPKTHRVGWTSSHSCGFRWVPPGLRSCPSDSLVSFFSFVFPPSSYSSACLPANSTRKGNNYIDIEKAQKRIWYITTLVR